MAENDGKLRGLENEMGLEKGDLSKHLHIPSIIHTTIGRSEKIL